MTFDWWLIVIVTLGGIGNLWTVYDSNKLNTDPHSLIKVENGKLGYMFAVLAIWVDMILLIKII